MLPPSVAAELRGRGRDVAAVAERAELRSISDEEALAVARREGRAIVTANIKDFRRLAAAEAAAGRPFPPLILLPSRSWPHFGQRIAGRLVIALDALLASGEAAEGEHWLQPPD